MRKGKVKTSALWLMIALLISCVLSTTVFSGENPWDSDHRPSQSNCPPGGNDSTSVNSGSTSRATVVGGSATSSSESGWVQTVHRVLMFVARHHAEWLRESSRSAKLR